MNEYIYIIFLLQIPHLTRPFDWSNSLFKSQEILVNKVGNAICLTNFTPVKLDHLRFVNRLLEASCAPDICCAVTGTFPAYIAGVLNSYYSQRTAVGKLHIAGTDSSILDKLYSKHYALEVGPFEFRLTEWLEYERFSDYSIYEIVHENESVAFHIIIVDVSAYCESQSNINLAEFIWKHVCEFAVKT